MVWKKTSRFIAVGLFFIFGASFANAQESLWKTFNPYPDREVPSYGGGLSPFPQRQEKIEEIEFSQTSMPISDITQIDEDESLSEEEKRLMLTTSILAELKAFLAEESVFIPNLDNVVVEGIAKANGQYKALIKGRWRSVGDTLKVPVNEALEALNLLDRLNSVDEQIAQTVEAAVLERTQGKGNEIIKLEEISEDKVVFTGHDGQEYVVNFIKAPF